MPDYDFTLSYSPIGNADDVRELVQKFKNGAFDLDGFFRNALLPFYDVMWFSLRGQAGHILYRLSDSVPEEKRKKIAIYSSREGSLILDPRNGDIDDYKWDSLEDWRKLWEKIHPYIPELMKSLPEGSDISDFLLLDE